MVMYLMIKDGILEKGMVINKILFEFSAGSKFFNNLISRQY